jgi:hypothetical protein
MCFVKNRFTPPFKLRQQAENLEYLLTPLELRM